MIFSTTGNIEGRPVRQYCGLVAGEAVAGVNAIRDMFAGVVNMTGGRAKGIEEELRKAREVATDILEKNALEYGANAVIGIDVDYEVMGKDNGMIMVSVTGTAVII